MDHTELRVVRAGEQDRHTVLQVLAEYLPGADVEARHGWLYERNPHGRAVTFIAFDSRGVALGLTSLFPRRVQVEGVVRTGAIGGDGFVRPAHRRRGVATALHAACLEAMRSGSADEVEFMYGGPVPNNLKALERAGSRVISSLCRHVRPRVLHRFTRRLDRGRITLDPLVSSDRRVAEVFERCSGSAAILPVRDPAHYEWRFGATPARAQQAFAVMQRGRAIALCALERSPGRVALVDFLAPPDEHAGTLWATADALGEVEVLTMANLRAPASTSLWRAGFAPRESKGFQVLAPPDHPAQKALFDPKRWYYQWADGDLDRLF